MAQNKDLVDDAQTLLEENLSEKKSVESARRLIRSRLKSFYFCISFRLHIVFNSSLAFLIFSPFYSYHSRF